MTKPKTAKKSPRYPKTVLLELSALMSATRHLVEAEDGDGSYRSEHPVSYACEILAIAQARCKELGGLLPGGGGLLPGV